MPGQGYRNSRLRLKMNYNKISNHLRHKLAEMVYMDNYLLKDAANLLNINYSTAKTILRIFRKEKRLKKKNSANVLDQSNNNAENRSRNINFVDNNLCIDNVCNSIRKMTEAVNKCNESNVLNQQMINNLMIMNMRITDVFMENSDEELGEILRQTIIEGLDKNII